MTETILTTSRLIIRNWREEDRDLFHEINSDPDVMEFFPRRRNRQESDELFDYLRKLIADTGLGFYALEHTETADTLGFCGIMRTSHEPAIPDGTVEIGWRLAKRHWGAGYVSEAATALLQHGFDLVACSFMRSAEVSVHCRMFLYLHSAIRFSFHRVLYAVSNFRKSDTVNSCLLYFLVHCLWSGRS